MNHVNHGTEKKTVRICGRQMQSVAQRHQRMLSHNGNYKMHYLEKSSRGKENERERDRENCQREKNLIGLILEGLPLCRLKSQQCSTLSTSAYCKTSSFQQTTLDNRSLSENKCSLCILSVDRLHSGFNTGSSCNIQTYFLKINSFEKHYLIISCNYSII